MLEQKIAFVESKILCEKQRALEYKKNKNDRGSACVYVYVYASFDQNAHLPPLTPRHHSLDLSALAAALQCMRRKALLEKQVEQHSNQLLRLDEQLMHVETSKATAEVFQSMKTMNEATRSHLRNARIQEFDRVIEKAQETQEEIEEFNQAMGRSFDLAQQLDDDHLLDELQEMAAASDAETADAAAAAAAIREPVVDEPEPGLSDREDDVETEELRASLAM